MRDLVAVLERWFADNCDGDWEHGLGVRINTLDNPGWSVDINVAGTAVEEKPFLRIQDEHNEDDWVHCWVETGLFKGRGGPRNLRDILAAFASWSGASDDSASQDPNR